MAENNKDKISETYFDEIYNLDARTFMHRLESFKCSLLKKGKNQ